MENKKRNIRRTAAVILSAAMMTSGFAFNTPQMVVSSPVCAVEAFVPSTLLESATGNVRCTVYNDGESTFNMNGRTYSQGVVMGTGYSGDSEVVFDVRDISTVSFYLGHVDNSNSDSRNPSSAEFIIYLDDVEVDMFTLFQHELINEYSIDVSDASTMKVLKKSGTRFALADISVDEKNVQTYTVPQQESSASFINNIYDSYRTLSYDGTNSKEFFNMQGRKYYNGLVLGYGSINFEAGFTVNVENINNISFTLGHVDNTTMYSADLRIYIDNVLKEELRLTPNKPLFEYSIDVSGATTLRIEKEGYDTAYAIADICVDEAKPEIPHVIPDYKTSAMFVNGVYNSLNTTAYDGFSTTNSFQMCGRDYYQGIVIGKIYEYESYFSLNVENLETFTCDLGHVDDTALREMDIAVYLDDKLVDTIKLSPHSAVLENYSIDVSKAKVLTITGDSNYASYGLGNIRTESLEPKNSVVVPEYETVKDFISSYYNLNCTTVYTGVNQTKFTMNDKDYTLGFILGNDDFGVNPAISFNVENISSISFNIGLVGTKTNNSETLYICKDGKVVDKILLTSENIKKANPYTIDTSDCSNIYIYKDSYSTKYGFADFKIEGLKAKPPVTEPPSTTVTTVTTTAPQVTTTTVKATTAPPVTTTTVKATTAPPVTTTTVKATTAPPVTTTTVKATTSQPVTTTTEKVITAQSVSTTTAKTTTTKITTKPVTTAKPLKPATTTTKTTTAMTTTTVMTPEVVAGDVNSDGSVTTSDVRWILQYIVGKVKLSDEQTKVADCTKDGTINTADALKLLRYIIGEIDSI